MIYEINGKYYIKVSPFTYNEIEMELKDDEVVVVSKPNRIEATGPMVITAINFQAEKDKFKEQLLQEQETETSEETGTEKRKYRRG